MIDTNDEEIDQPNERDVKILNLHVARLQEHFSTVQVFCTKVKDKNNTTSFHAGKGNWFARYGQVQMWVKTEEERGL